MLERNLGGHERKTGTAGARKNERTGRAWGGMLAEGFLCRGWYLRRYGGTYMHAIQLWGA